jgi:hypothetical protein
VPGRSSQSRSLRYLGALVGLAGVVGYVAFGWGFGDTSGTLPLVIGILAALVAVLWTLYQRLRDHP